MAIELLDEYVQDVQAQPEKYCKWVRLAISRHTNDLKREDIRFDRKEAEKGLSFIKKLRHTKGKGYKGKLFDLKPFQAFIAGSIFGWKDKDGLRRFRTAYNKIARKNAKTELGAAIALYIWWSDRKGAPEVHCAATKREQAAIAFDAIHAMATALAKESPSFRNQTIIRNSQYNKKIYLKEGGFIQTLGRDSKNEDGFFPLVGFIDEYHAHPTNQMIDILESGFGSREEPLTLIITTAGVNRFSPSCQFEMNICQKVLEGSIQDDSLFCIMFDIDDGDAWDDETIWGKANPLAVNIPAMLKTLSVQAEKAALYGAEKLNSFLTKNLNIWTNSHSSWFSDEQWMSNEEQFDPKNLIGRTCFAGLDLASTRDLNALVLFFPATNKGEKHVVLPFFFAPRCNAEERSKTDRVPYLDWEKEGFLTLTPGNSTDYDAILETIVENNGLYNIESLAYDKFNSSYLISNLQKHGITDLEHMAQTLATMSPPTKELERMIAESEINHLNNPVLRWMMGNVAIYSDGNDRIKPDKAASKDRIDGIVALVMAVGEWLDWLADPKRKKSIYEEGTGV